MTEVSGKRTVLVVGAGPAGLATACGLRQQGVDVRVVDQADGPATTSRANIVHARGTEVLDRLGAVDDLRDRGVSAMRITMYLGGEPIATIAFGKIEGAPLSALLVSQAEVEAKLRGRFDELGGTIEWNCGLIDAEQDAEGVTARLTTGEHARADWLVGCDGAHSAVRKVAGIGFPGAPVADQWLLADVHADWDTDRTGTAGWYHHEGTFFAMPMRDPDGREDLWRLMADVPVGEAPSDDEVLDRLRALLPRRTGLTDVRLGEPKWTSSFRIHRRLADRYRDGRILLVGDAAHIHSPFGGQGLNTGLSDAENLAWKLGLVVGGEAGPALLDTYEAERRPLAEEVLRGTTMNTRVLTGQGVLGRFLRDRVLTPLGNLPFVQRWATRNASQLWVSYRRGPLGGTWRGKRPRPGERVRDLECRLPDGTATRLHRELRGRWAVLGAEDCAEVARGSLGEHVVWLPAEGETLLVRPDAHLAWRGTESAGLRQWLGKALR